MTAHALEGQRELCLEHDMDDYIAKPINKTAIADALAKWADRNEQAPQSGLGTGDAAPLNAAASGADPAPSSPASRAPRLSF